MLKSLFFFIFLFSFLELNAQNEEYFLTLRYNEVNLRQGPSREYPIKIFYKKKFLPVIIQDQSDNFRKIRDHENNSGWIHVSQLSKRKAAITVDEDVMIFKRPTVFSKPQVKLQKGKLCLISKCSEEWCKVRVNDYKGWIKKESLWGRL
tara:strand:- start:366 stop:812 length:447 start_codon:yes stop_codon:yes gene_type:complete